MPYAEYRRETRFEKVYSSKATEVEPDRATSWNKFLWRQSQSSFKCTYSTGLWRMGTISLALFTFQEMKCHTLSSWFLLVYCFVCVHVDLCVSGWGYLSEGDKGLTTYSFYSPGTRLLWFCAMGDMATCRSDASPALAGKWGEQCGQRRVVQ